MTLELVIFIDTFKKILYELGWKEFWWNKNFCYKSLVSLRQVSMLIELKLVTFTIPSELELGTLSCVTQHYWCRVHTTTIPSHEFRRLSSLENWCSEEKLYSLHIIYGYISSSFVCMYIFSKSPTQQPISMSKKNLTLL